MSKYRVKPLRTRLDGSRIENEVIGTVSDKEGKVYQPIKITVHTMPGYEYD